MRVGVFGGTFDPVHNGHLAAARAAAAAANLDEVLFVPVGNPGHRTPPVASAAQRLAMLDAALADARAEAASDAAVFSISDIDASRDGQTFSVNTLRDIHAGRPDDELFFILGADSYARFDTWRDPEGIRALARLLVVDRSLPASAVGTARADDSVQFVALSGFDISASDIRRRCAAGESVAELVAPAVERFIRAHRVYSEDAQS